MSEPAPETVAPETVETTEPAEPAWGGPSQDEWTQTQQALGSIIQALTPPPEQGTVDPFAENFTDQLNQWAEQKFAPYQQFQQETALREAEEQAMGILEEMAEKDGGFLLPDSLAKARTLANDFLPQAQQQFGYGPKAAQAALEAAYKATKEWEQKVGEAYQARQTQHLRGLASARREPAPAGQNGAASITEIPANPQAVFEKYFGRS